MKSFPVVFAPVSPCGAVPGSDAYQVTPRWHAVNPIHTSIISNEAFIVGGAKLKRNTLLSSLVQRNCLLDNGSPLGVGDPACYNPALRKREINSFGRFSNFNHDSLSWLAVSALFRQNERRRGGDDIVASRRYAFESITTFFIRLNGCGRSTL